MSTTKMHAYKILEKIKSPSLTWGRVTPYMFISPWILGFVFFTLGPLALSFVMSFYDWPVVGVRTFVGTENYTTMLSQDPMFWHSLWITLKFGLWFVPFNMVLSLLLALLLNQKLVGVSVFRAVFYLPSIISGVSLVTIWAWIFSHEYGILNFFLAQVGIDGPNWLANEKTALLAIVIASLWGLGGNMLIFLAGLQSVPKDLYEVASLSGIPKVVQFLRITLPMLSPIILFTLVTSIIAAFQQLTIALLLTGGGPMDSTYFFAMYIYENAFTHFEMGYAAANSWFMFLIIFTLSMLVVRSSSAWVYYESEMQRQKKDTKNES